ncbi:hypothetical protein D3C77_652770 [compost metagenome]
MKLLTIFELAAKSESELRALYREAFNEAATADQTSQERENALASLANIQRMMSARARHP